MVVVGAGVIGIEYASMFAALGTKVTVVEQRDRMLDFCDDEIVEALKYHLRDLAVTFRFGETVAAVREAPERHAHASWRAARRSRPTPCMYSAGRQGVDRRARPARRPGWRPTTAAGSRSTSTSAPRSTHIYAVGDVIGFPALAATVDGAGPAGRAPRLRRAGRSEMHDLQPIGIYTIPEISYVGPTEDELTDDSGAVRGRASPATASWPAARSSATPTAC